MAVPIVDPFDPQMPFPIDLRTVRQNTAQRDDIPSNARYEGLLVYITGEDRFYYLKNGVTNADWTLLGDSDGGSEFIQSVYYNPAQPTNQGKNGDIWFRPFNDQIQLYYRVGDVWGLLGSWGVYNGAKSVEDLTLSYDETSVTLNSKHPGLLVGDRVYNESLSLVFEKSTPTRWVMVALI